MTDNNHPITPPPELVQKWINEEQGVFAEHIATQAARWGADQELDACCSWVTVYCPRLPDGAYPCDELYVARRPKPPSLKEQALEALDEEHADMRIQNYKLIRSVLESLPD